MADRNTHTKKRKLIHTSIWIVSSGAARFVVGRMRRQVSKSGSLQQISQDTGGSLEQNSLKKPNVILLVGNVIQLYKYCLSVDDGSSV